MDGGVTAVSLRSRLEHEVERRLGCAAEVRETGVGEDLPQPTFAGLRAQPEAATNEVALVHGTSRADKAWPLSHWVELGQRLDKQGCGLALMHGNDNEACEASQIQAQLKAAGAQVDLWPRSDLSTLTKRLAACRGVIGVDGGVSHIAVALGLPHVQIYNFDTAWRTGPLHEPQQISVFDSPFPSVDQVWQAWLTSVARAV